MSARLPETFQTKPKDIFDRHSGYTLSKNSLASLFFHEDGQIRNLFFVPPFFTYSADSLGFRKHRPNSVGSSELTAKANVLVLGDSFTFGSEVSDLATWPAYLERLSSKTVHNAGSGWFGSAQAVARGYAVSPTMSIDTVILSVLVDHDIKRDRWVSHGYDRGRRRPVVDRNGVLMHLPAYSVKAKEQGIIHSEATDVDSIMDYALQRLLQIPANKHIILLQYYPNLVYAPSKVALEEQALWVKKAKAWSIPVVDTFNMLKKAKDSHSPLWIGNALIPQGYWGHHTSYGNEIVAQAILDSGVLD